MIVQIKKWGNSQGIRIPKEILDKEGIKTDDYLKIEIVDDRLVLTKSKPRSLKERLEGLGEIPKPSKEDNWGDPVGKEVL